jgi:hypothetical protein
MDVVRTDGEGPEKKLLEGEPREEMKQLRSR